MKSSDWPAEFHCLTEGLDGSAAPSCFHCSTWSSVYWDIIKVILASPNSLSCFTNMLMMYLRLTIIHFSFQQTLGPKVKVLIFNMVLNCRTSNFIQAIVWTTWAFNQPQLLLANRKDFGFSNFHFSHQSSLIPTLNLSRPWNCLRMSTFSIFTPPLATSIPNNHIWWTECETG